MQPRGRTGSFFLGLATGAMAATLAVVAGLYAVSSNGIKVRLDGEALASRVRVEVSEAARQRLPQLIQQAKREVPARVSQEIKGKLGEARISISGIDIALPREVIDRLEGMMEAHVKAVLFDILDQMDTAGAAEEMGDEAYALTMRLLEAELDGLELKALGRVSIPVLLEMR